MKSLTPPQLKEFLLNVAVVRPVFIWGAPGIGKTAVVNQFAAELGMEAISMLGSQLAPEDLIGVPRVIDDMAVFSPPRQLASHKEPFVLFIDEFNASSPEVQKSFYSLILEHRLGEFMLPSGSIVILAGNRAQDNAIVRTVSSALMNRVIHVELRVSSRAWLEWAKANAIHPLVVEYIEARPDHLFSEPPKREEPFSSPRSWHILSDALTSYFPGETDIDPAIAEVLAVGSLTAGHALAFLSFLKQQLLGLRVEDILLGKQQLPMEASRRDLLFFLVEGMRSQLVKELPATKEAMNDRHKTMLHEVRRIVAILASQEKELVMRLLTHEEGDGARNYPAWFIIEITKTLPKLLKAQLDPNDVS